MVKRELIAALARRHKSLKAKDVEFMARLIFDTMTAALERGEEIEFRGFGAFRLREYEPRKARNPGSGENLQLEARRGILFRAGRDIREKLNGE